MAATTFLIIFGCAASTARVAANQVFAWFANSKRARRPSRAEDRAVSIPLCWNVVVLDRWRINRGQLLLVLLLVLLGGLRLRRGDGLMIPVVVVLRRWRINRGQLLLVLLLVLLGGLRLRRGDGLIIPGRGGEGLAWPPFPWLGCGASVGAACVACSRNKRCSVTPQDPSAVINNLKAHLSVSFPGALLAHRTNPPGWEGRGAPSLAPGPRGKALAMARRPLASAEKKERAAARKAENARKKARRQQEVLRNLGPIGRLRLV